MDPIQSNGRNHILCYWFDITPSIGKSRLEFGSLAKILDCKGIPFEHFWGGSRPMRSLDSGLSTNHRPRFQAIFFLRFFLMAITLLRFSQSSTIWMVKLWSTLLSHFQIDTHLNTTLLPMDNHLNSTWLPLDYHLTTTWLPLDYHLTATWLPLGYHLTTTWLPLDYHLTTTCTPLDYHLTTKL